MNEKTPVKNYYQGIYLTETIMGNPNGDFIDNSPRNIDGAVFTTDKCIKYNIRKYIHDTIENFDEKQNVVFFFPRLVDSDNGEEVNQEDMKFKTRDQIFNYFENFEEILKCSPDVRMFGGTFSVGDNAKQIYGPIQLSYGLDINEAQIIRHQIGAPFSTTEGSQKTFGSESVVDDAIIAYDITINPNNYKELLSEDDLKLFKLALWEGTNLRKTTSKKTDSKLLMLIKFKNESEDNNVDAINMGELKHLISMKGNKSKKMDEVTIELDCTNLVNKIKKYENYIESIEIYCDSEDIKLNNLDILDKNTSIKVTCEEPLKLRSNTD